MTKEHRIRRGAVNQTPIAKLILVYIIKFSLHITSFIEFIIFVSENLKSGW